MGVAYCERGKVGRVINRQSRRMNDTYARIGMEIGRTSFASFRGWRSCKVGNPDLALKEFAQQMLTRWPSWQCDKSHSEWTGLMHTSTMDGQLLFACCSGSGVGSWLDLHV